MKLPRLIVAGFAFALSSAGIDVIAQVRPQQRDLDPQAGLSAILLGTGVPLPDPRRGTACTAVIAGNRVFLVDTGRNCVVALDQAGIFDVNAIFYTHYHSDHFIGLGEILLNFGIAGIDRSIPVHGPPGAAEVVAGIGAAYPARPAVSNRPPRREIQRSGDESRR